jgi:hypothetical protein
MKIEIDKALIEEIALCIVDCNLNQADAVDYAWRVCVESLKADFDEVSG